jgi:hypothetical protein
VEGSDSVSTGRGSGIESSDRDTYPPELELDDEPPVFKLELDVFDDLELDFESLSFVPPSLDLESAFSTFCFGVKPRILVLYSVLTCFLRIRLKVLLDVRISVLD